MKMSIPSAFIQIDSRKVMPGDLFAALKGARVDGHDFLKEAKERGASHALVRHDYAREDFGLALLRTDDPLKCLQEWAKEKVLRLRPKIIAITGSVGKTSTKEILYAILKRKFSCAKSPGNANSQVGLPLTLLNVWKEEPLLILEMGMMARGEIARLVSIAPPDIAAITEIAPVHIEGLGSLENIALAKGEIFSSPHTRFGLIKKGVAFESLLEKQGISQKIRWSPDDKRFPIPKLPPHLAVNFILACRIAELLGCTRGDMEAIAQFPPEVEGRFQTVVKGGITFINDGYNASELSVAAALSNLPQAPRKIALLGEMMELGAESEEVHRRVGKKALESVDFLFTIGEGTQAMEAVFSESGKRAVCYKTTIEAEAALKGFLKPGDLVLVKGSRKWELSEMVKRWPE
jgi:UDP-N-acetylmuramoyl-tripeptide--D-alanyl-D-alanine ligase